MNNESLINLNGELGAIIQYLTYAAKAAGSYRRQPVQFFLDEVAVEQIHLQFLANKIVALDGEPTTTPRDVPAPQTNREMLEAVLAAERQATIDPQSDRNRPRSLTIRNERFSWMIWYATKAITRRRPKRS